MQVCFHCGSANSTDAKVCHSCSARLGADDESTSENSEEQSLEEAVNECPYCGQALEEGSQDCVHCRSSVVSADPLDRPAPKTHEQDITTRYDEFAGRVQQVRDGRMSRKQFVTWLGNIQQSLVVQRDRYIELIRTSGYYDFGSDEVDMGMTGILDYEAAMEMMGLYAQEDTDISVLDAALRRMWEGNENCNEAMRINREFRAKLEEDWGYM